MFPPAVGGSGALLDSVYARVRQHVTVLTDRGTVGEQGLQRPPYTIAATDLRGDLWGVADPASLAQHLRVARLIRRLGAGGVVHCGRAQPEGLAGLIASLGPGGPRFVFWAHGEEITMAQTSREFRWVMRRVYARASRAIANSRNTARLLELAGMPASRIEVIHPGVDGERFSPAVDGSLLRARFAPAGQLLLLSVGRLQRRKGHDLTIEALARCRTRLPPFHYLIVGDGHERQSLEALALARGLIDVVSFTGSVPADELPSYFAAGDIFVHPNRIVDSADFEGFGMVFLEAAATEKPVIGGATGGVVEAVVDGTTGLLVGGTDPDELALAIERLARSPDLRQQLGRAGRARVLTDFTWDSAARRVEQIHAAVAALP
jgi:phosphatidylinositol alpha-1,6-mannosyltransferase